MGTSDEQQDRVPPSEQRGGSTPGSQEAESKGPWAASATEGVVPAELGGSDAREEQLGEDPQLEGSVLGATTGSDEPATEAGVDASAGDNADAVSAERPQQPEGAEPDLKDAASGARQADVESAE